MYFVKHGAILRIDLQAVQHTRQSGASSDPRTIPGVPSGKQGDRCAGRTERSGTATGGHAEPQAAGVAGPQEFACDRAVRSGARHSPSAADGRPGERAGGSVPPRCRGTSEYGSLRQAAE
ncbi:hypothetical protein SHO565_58640 [Streptomyces sp. HO565]